MSYSCCDFTEAVCEALKLSDPTAEIDELGTLAVAEIERLRGRDAICTEALAALKLASEIITLDSRQAVIARDAADSVLAKAEGTL